MHALLDFLAAGVHAPVGAVLLGLASASALLFLAWAIQLRTRNAGIADTLWSWALGLLGALNAVLGSAPAPLRLLLGLLAGAWGLRLGTYLLLRNRGKPEDGRYLRFRKAWGVYADRNMFWFLQLQALFALLLSAGFLAVAWRPDWPAPAALGAALAVWLLAVGGEALADQQLERFKRDPAHRGRVYRRGLWRYSRHPNYFFECLHWVAYLLLAWGAPAWWLALAPPLIMAYLLLCLSGIPLTEAQAARTRPDYADYIRSTSAFFPWPPKKP